MQDTLTDNKPDTTVLYYNGAYWVASGLWRNPVLGLRLNPDKWSWLGSSGWFRTIEIKAKYLALVDIVGVDMMPQWPGEYTEFKNKMSYYHELVAKVFSALISAQKTKFHLITKQTQQNTKYGENLKRIRAMLEIKYKLELIENDVAHGTSKAIIVADTLRAKYKELKQLIGSKQ